MRQYHFFILIIFCWSIHGEEKFKHLGQNPEALQTGVKFSTSSLQIVQKRWLPKRFLSEFSLSVSPNLKGFNYMNNFSTDVTYRFFLNNHWSIQLKYLQHSNLINSEGSKEIEQRGRIPIELKYPQKKSYFVGIDWYPFYGKILLYNQLVSFDLYFSLLRGKVELLDLKKKFPVNSFGFGVVCWWHKNFNTRLELQGSYYKYDFSNGGNKISVEEYLSNISLSAGVLF